MSGRTRGTPWSDEENAIITAAYFEMLALETRGETFVKADINRRLQGELPMRGRGSIEFKLQNVSAVLFQAGLPFVSGYVPAKNFQRSLRDPVLAAAERLGIYDRSQDVMPTPDEDELDRRTARLLERGSVAMPVGTEEPETREIVQSAFMRDPKVKAWVLQYAEGICELCREPGPFLLPDGSRYLEVHHVEPLAAGGADTTSNAVAVCPNCHRRLHLSSDKDVALSRLTKQVARLSDTDRRTS